MRRGLMLLAANMFVWTACLAEDPPYAPAPGLFDATHPEDLGLSLAPGEKTFTVFRPGPKTDKYSNGVVLMPFKGKLYAQWQSSAVDEDTPDTWVAYAVSRDGAHWSMPKALQPHGQNGVMVSSGGWWRDEHTLVAYINVWPHGFASGNGGYAMYRTSQDGVHWTPLQHVLAADGTPVEGVIEQDPHAVTGGRIVTAFHLRPGMIVTPFYTDDRLGVRGWMRGEMQNLPHAGTVSREIEPSLFVQQSCLVMVFRDQDSSFRQLAARSCDGGAHWSTPVPTAMPDARAKQSAGNLPDGSAFLVNAPSGTKTRLPLVLSLSADGRLFDRAYVLRGGLDLQPMRYPGKFKHEGYHYPKSVIWKDALYVGYATNKEDVEITRIPLKNHL